MIFSELADSEVSKRVLAKAGLLGNEQFLVGIEAYYRYLIKINETLNLTRITSPEDFWIKNILDTLLIVHEVPELVGSDLERYVRVVDMGCGGGIPLIPLALAFPYCEFVGFESRQKKAFFLQDVIEFLELKNCQVFPLRSGEASLKPDFRGSFDIVTARAVAKIEKLVPETVKFLSPKGRMVFYKTPSQLDEEFDSATKAAKTARLEIKRSSIFELPYEFGLRQFAILKPISRRRRK
jgi:16S rRNA (guanine527-N7)-methyltransferase